MFSCEQDDGLLVFEGDLKISEVDAISNCLRPFFTDDQQLKLDLSQVSEVDTAGLQLLLAFCLSRTESSPTTLVNIQPSLKKAMQLTGLDQHFKPYIGS